MSAPLTPRQSVMGIARVLRGAIQVAGTVQDERMRLVAHHLIAAADLLVEIGDAMREESRR